MSIGLPVWHITLSTLLESGILVMLYLGDGIVEGAKRR